MGTYRTIKKSSSSLYKEKGSKFYGYAFPINKADDVKEKLDLVQEKHPKARHICTAFLTGIGSEEYYLVNDDGEPSNSAGMPILAAIRSAEITNTFIAVVRYFGGTKLGVGGLISAYRTAAKEALENNKIIEIEPKVIFQFSVGYELLGEILSVADRNNLEIEQEHGSKGVSIKVECKEDNLEATKSLFVRFDLTIS